MRAWRRGGTPGNEDTQCKSDRAGVVPAGAVGVVEMGQQRKQRGEGQPRSQPHCEGTQPRAHTYAGAHQTCQPLHNQI